MDGPSVIRWSSSPIHLPSDAQCQMSLCPPAPDPAGKVALDPPPNNAFWLTASNCDQSSLVVRTNQTLLHTTVFQVAPNGSVSRTFCYPAIVFTQTTLSLL